MELLQSCSKPAIYFDKTYFDQFQLLVIIDQVGILMQECGVCSAKQLKYSSLALNHKVIVLIVYIFFKDIP